MAKFIGPLALLLLCTACTGGVMDGGEGSPDVPSPGSDSGVDPSKPEAGDARPPAQDAGAEQDSGRLDGSDPPPVVVEITCDWNVLSGPVPAGTSTVFGDGSDETAEIQVILDAADSGDVVCFPNPPSHYSVSGLTIRTEELTLYGAGWAESSASGFEALRGVEHVGPRFRQRGGGGSIVNVAADGVTIDGLQLEGAGYVADGGNGVQLARVQRATIRNSLITDTGGRAINLSRDCGDFLVENNRLERHFHAGVYVYESSRGQIVRNRIYDLNFPTSGSAGMNAYGIILTGYGREYPVERNLIQDNYVGHINVWHGINIHGGAFNLCVDNEIEDVVGEIAGGLIKTYVPGQRDWLHDHNVLVNNTVRDIEKYGSWSIGLRQLGDDLPYEVDNWFIGNRYERVQTSIARGQRGARYHHNVWIEPPATRWSFYNGNEDTHVSNNTPTGGFSLSSQRNDFDAPSAAPTGLSVERGPGVNVVRWEFPTGGDHDSFELQHSADGDSWNTLAFRPPNSDHLPRTSSNANITIFDPLRYVYVADSLFGYYRIRTWNGDASTGWSEIVAAP